MAKIQSITKLDDLGHSVSVLWEGETEVRIIRDKEIALYLYHMVCVGQTEFDRCMRGARAVNGF